METSVFVVVVPMFAPMSMGTAAPTVSTFPATKPTMILVVVDELWIRLVARNPMKSPATGSVAVFKSCSAKPRLPILNAVLISLMLKKNRYSRPRK